MELFTCITWSECAPRLYHTVPQETYTSRVQLQRRASLYMLLTMWYLHNVYRAMKQGCGGQCVHYLLTYRLRNTRLFTKKNCRRIWFPERIYYRIITYRNSLQKKHMTTPREHVLLNKKMNKIHFADEHPNFHVYNMHCRKRSSLRECNPKNVHHCTCYLPLFDWMDWGTYNMYTAQWWKDVVINVYLMCLHVVYRILATTRKKGYIADSQKKHMTTSRDHLPFNKQLQSTLCR